MSGKKCEWFVIEDRGDIFFEEIHESEEEARSAMIWHFKRRTPFDRRDILANKGKVRLYVAHTSTEEELGSAEWFDSIDETISMEDALKALEEEEEEEES